MAHSNISKDLKQPDEFVSFWTHLGQKLSTHRHGVIAAGVAVVLGTGGGWGYLTWQESRAMDATEGFARIEKNALAPVVPDKADDAKAGKPAKAETDDILHFKTDEERLAATIKEADDFVAAHGTSGLANVR